MQSRLGLTMPYIHSAGLDPVFFLVAAIIQMSPLAIITGGKGVQLSRTEVLVDKHGYYNQ